jgi:hypothetical protein
LKAAMSDEYIPASGLPVDRSGRPTIDPTANVIALNSAANKRQDDLRDASDKFNAAAILNMKDTNGLHMIYMREISLIHERYSQQLRTAESDRLNSIRQIDREEVNKTAAQAQTAITTLATQTNTLAETLRNQVATTAMQATQQRAIDNAEVNKRVSALELSSSAGKGKEAGLSASQQMMLAIATLIFLALTAYGALKPAAQIIVPAVPTTASPQK